MQDQLFSRRTPHEHRGLQVEHRSTQHEPPNPERPPPCLPPPVKPSRRSSWSCSRSWAPRPDALSPTATFEDLDVDSRPGRSSQIVEEQYGVKLQGEDVAKLRTVEDAVNLITERAAQGPARPSREVLQWC